MSTPSPEPVGHSEISGLFYSGLTPYELYVSDDPETQWLDLQPGEREFYAAQAARYPDYEREQGEATAARMAELERQAAEHGVDVFGDPLPQAARPAPQPQAADPEPEAEP